MFFIKYLITLGFDATNDIFAENAWYFRNALVRANYNDLKHGVHETTEYLELFLRNLLLDETNELHNRTMHISGMFDMKPKAGIDDQKADIEDQKTDIEGRKADIEEAKTNIHDKMENFMPEVSKKTIDHIMLIYDQYGNETFFGRNNVEAITGLKSTRASELLKLLVHAGIIQPVKGHGKGKYRFY